MRQLIFEPDKSGENGYKVYFKEGDLDKKQLTRIFTLKVKELTKFYESYTKTDVTVARTEGNELQIRFNNEEAFKMYWGDTLTVNLTAPMEKAFPVTLHANDVLTFTETMTIDGDKGKWITPTDVKVYKYGINTPLDFSDIQWPSHVVPTVTTQAPITEYKLPAGHFKFADQNFNPKEGAMLLVNGNETLTYKGGTWQKMALPEKVTTKSPEELMGYYETNSAIAGWQGIGPDDELED